MRPGIDAGESYVREVAAYLLVRDTAAVCEAPRAGGGWGGLQEALLLHTCTVLCCWSGVLLDEDGGSNVCVLRVHSGCWLL